MNFAHLRISCLQSLFALPVLLVFPLHSYGSSTPLNLDNTYSFSVRHNYLIAQSYNSADYNESVKLFNLGKYTEAIAAFSRIISNTSTPVPLRNKALIGRSQAFLVINQPSLAIVDLKKINYNPSQGYLIGNKEMILGVAFIQIKQYQIAIKHLSEAIKYLPNDDSVFANRSVAYQAIKNYGAAVKDIERALEINPTLSSIFNLAVLEKDRKNFSRCYALLSQLDEKNSAYADIYLQRGLCLKALKKYKRALEDFLRASSIDSTKAEAIENTGLMLAILGDNNTALKYLESASSLYLQQGNIKAFEAVSEQIARLSNN